MDRPLIGITTDTHPRPDHYESPIAYARAVEAAGGLAVLLPYHADLSLVPQYARRLDGMVFSGGNDLNPQHYGQTFHPKAIPIDPARERFELALLAEVERLRVPILGICLGAQLMNIHRGGSLLQFLPDVPRHPQLEHRKLGETAPRHKVDLDPASQLGRWLNKREIDANSSHKQAVDRPGRGLRIIATAPDGVIEGMEDPDYPLFMAVQWHPERLHDEPDHLSIFRLLVERAAGRKAGNRP
ncbi:MAG: gamma-glutamyl-gamma-aminobutyrate hydrolase family protein [Phycisphaerales bacterium]|nr:gamma-glutamyl-gamma-aminobutyrate hydrolase family protein [Phycisphaerales bacterium]